MTEPPFPPDRTESHDTVLFEFTDSAIEIGFRPVRPEVIRHAPTALRAKYEQSGRRPDDPTALADCLMAQARLLLSVGRLPQAVIAADKAQGLYEKIPSAAAALADCYHLAAKLREALGQNAEALAFLELEATLRRRLLA